MPQKMMKILSKNKQIEQCICWKGEVSTPTYQPSQPAKQEQTTAPHTLPSTTPPTKITSTSTPHHPPPNLMYTSLTP